MNWLLVWFFKILAVRIEASKLIICLINAATPGLTNCNWLVVVLTVLTLSCLFGSRYLTKTSLLSIGGAIGLPWPSLNCPLLSTVPQASLSVSLTNLVSVKSTKSVIVSFSPILDKGPANLGKTLINLPLVSLIKFSSSLEVSVSFWGAVSYLSLFASTSLPSLWRSAKSLLISANFFTYSFSKWTINISWSTSPNWTTASRGSFIADNRLSKPCSNLGAIVVLITALNLALLSWVSNESFLSIFCKNWSLVGIFLIVVLFSNAPNVSRWSAKCTTDFL